MAKRTDRTGPPSRKPRKPASKAATRRETWKPVFLAALAECANVSAAIRAAGITRDTAYAHKKSDAAFAAGWDAALDEAVDSLEREAWRRARDGVDLPILHEGSVVFGTVDRDGRHVPPPPMTDEGLKDAAARGLRIVPLVKKTYSDGLMQVLLKANRPHKYRENINHTADDVPGDDDGIVLVHTAPPAVPIPPVAAAAIARKSAAGAK